MTDGFIVMEGVSYEGLFAGHPDCARGHLVYPTEAEAREAAVEMAKRWDYVEIVRVVIP